MNEYVIPFEHDDISNERDLDQHIGERVKTRRLELGISQNKLGSYLGVTFQQIQKYEKGINRISASTLYNISHMLSVDLEYFFNGYEDTDCVSEDVTPSAYELDDIRKKETMDLLKAYYKISTPSVRKKMLELMKTFAAAESKPQ